MYSFFKGCFALISFIAILLGVMYFIACLVSVLEGREDGPVPLRIARPVVNFVAWIVILSGIYGGYLTFAGQFPAQQ